MDTRALGNAADGAPNKRRRTVRRPQKYVVDSFMQNAKASAEEERLFRLALENSKRVTSLPDLLNQVPDAPVFHPTL